MLNCPYKPPLIFWGWSTVDDHGGSRSSPWPWGVKVVTLTLKLGCQGHRIPLWSTFNISQGHLKVIGQRSRSKGHKGQNFNYSLSSQAKVISSRSWSQGHDLKVTRSRSKILKILFSARYLKVMSKKSRSQGQGQTHIGQGQRSNLKNTKHICLFLSDQDHKVKAMVSRSRGQGQGQNPTGLIFNFL